MRRYIDGLVQNYSNSSALAMDLLQPCTKPSIWCWILEVSLKIVVFAIKNIKLKILSNNFVECNCQWPLDINHWCCHDPQRERNMTFSFATLTQVYNFRLIHYLCRTPEISLRIRPISICITRVFVNSPGSIMYCSMDYNVTSRTHIV